MNTTETGAALGEIIATTTVAFTAEADVLHRQPALGSLVLVAGDEHGQTDVVAVVAFAQTGGVDPSRQAVRRGTEAARDAAIYREHPELRHVLRTTFDGVIVGYVDRAQPRRFLPPTPPPLHYTVRTADRELVRAFTDSPHYLSSLVAHAGEVAAEHLVAAHLRWVAASRGGDAAWLAVAARELARLMQQDYARLLTILRSVEPEAG